MTITKDVDISMDIDLNLTVDEIYNNLSSTEKEDLFEILSEYKSRNNKNYYLENLFLGRDDYDILTNRNIWEKIIRLIKYDNSELKDYIISELMYEPSKINKTLNIIKIKKGNK